MKELTLNREGLEEIWVDIIGWDGKYKVSSKSRIKSVNLKSNRERIIYDLKRKSKSYNKVTFIKDGKKYGISVHRVVATAFIPNTKNKPQVNHINGVKTDNRIENLEWATGSENAKHAIKIGLQKIRRGEAHSQYKKTGLLVLISKKCQCLCTGRIMAYSDARKEIGMSMSGFSKIMRGKTINWTYFIPLQK